MTPISGTTPRTMFGLQNENDRLRADLAEARGALHEVRLILGPSVPNHQPGEYEVQCQGCLVEMADALAAVNRFLAAHPEKP